MSRSIVQPKHRDEVYGSMFRQPFITSDSELCQQRWTFTKKRPSQIDPESSASHGTVPVSSPAAVKHLDKPLPPLPGLNSECPEQQAKEKQVGPLRRDNESPQRPRTSTQTLPAFFGVIKTIFRMGPKGSKEPRSEESKVIQPIYVDKGTQTSFEDLTKMKRLSQQSRVSQKSKSYAGSASAHKSRSYSHVSNRSKPSPLSSSVSANEPETRGARSIDVTPTAEGLQLALQRSASRDGSETDRSMDTLGTYESRYSFDLAKRSRPDLSRNAVSEPSVSDGSSKTDRPAGSHPLGRSTSTLRSASRQSSEESPRSCRRFSLNRAEASQSTTGSGISPMTLKQGGIAAIRPTLSTSNSYKRATSYHRVPVTIPDRDYFGSAVSQSLDTNIPDHYKSSPLCPLHPKHKLGRHGICHLHGAATSSDSEDTAREREVTSKTAIFPAGDAAYIPMSAGLKQIASILAESPRSSDGAEYHGQ